MDKRILMFWEERLMVYLMTLKITPNLKGHKYFKECVLRLCGHEEKKHHISKSIYQEVIELYNEKMSCFDRALRHSLEVSYNRGGVYAFSNMVKIYLPDKKLTPKELICLLAEIIKCDYLSKFPYSKVE